MSSYVHNSKLAVQWHSEQFEQVWLVIIILRFLLSFNIQDLMTRFLSRLWNDYEVVAHLESIAGREFRISQNIIQRLVFPIWWFVAHKHRKRSRSGALRTMPLASYWMPWVPRWSYTSETRKDVVVCLRLHAVLSWILGFTWRRIFQASIGT